MYRLKSTQVYAWWLHLKIFLGATKFRTGQRVTFVMEETEHQGTVEELLVRNPRRPHEIFYDIRFVVGKEIKRRIFAGGSLTAWNAGRK